jgi:hypothetical protein
MADNKNLIAGIVFVIIITILGVAVLLSNVNFVGAQGIQGIAGNNGLDFNSTAPYILLFNGTQGSSGLVSVSSPLLNSSGVLSLDQSLLSIAHSQINDWGTYLNQAVLTSSSPVFSALTLQGTQPQLNMSRTGGSSWSIFEYSDNNIYFQTATHNRMVLDTSGNLEIQGHLKLSQNNPNVYFASTDTTSSNRDFRIITGYNDYGIMEFQVGASQGAVPSLSVLSLDKSGNLVVLGTVTSSNINQALLTSSSPTFNGLALISASSGHICLTSYTSTDGQNRFLMTISGYMGWGDGTNAPDTNLYRSGANILKTDGSLIIVGSLTVGSNSVLTTVSGLNATNINSGVVGSSYLPTVTYGMTNFADQSLLTSSSPAFQNLTLSGYLGLNNLGKCIVYNSDPTNYFLSFATAAYGSWCFGVNSGGYSPMFQIYEVNTAKSLLALDSSGDLTVSGYVASANYLSGAYGATWESLPSFPTAVNGNYYVLWNTNLGVGRIYCYANGAWHWSALT